MLLNIIESLETAGDRVKAFLIDSEQNPIVWMGLFIFGLVVFFFTYNALHKEK